MATPQNSGNTPARQQLTKQDAASDTAHEDGLRFADVKHTAAPPPSAFNAPDVALEAAVAEAGANPERTEELAKELGIGSENKLTPQLKPMLDRVLAGMRLPESIRNSKPTTAPRSPLAHAIRQDVAYYPPECSFDETTEIPAGAFDAGLERVTAVNAVDGEISEMLRSEVERSVPLARYAGILTTCVYEENDLDGAAWWVREIATVCFQAGFLQGRQSEEVRNQERELGQLSATQGDTQDLVNLLHRRIDMDAVSDDALTGRGYWTPAQVRKAREYVRRELGGAR